MRRWNGWGDDTIEYPLPATAAGYLAERIGSGDIVAGCQPGERTERRSCQPAASSCPGDNRSLRALEACRADNRSRTGWH